MNLGITVKISGSINIERKASFLSQGGKDRILRALGAKLKYLTVQNFGATGTDRPSEWAPLSPHYAKRVKRPIATLELSGALLRSLRVSSPEGNSISVYTDSPYAEAHQKGNRNLLARPFFPVLPDGSATPRAQAILDTTAVQEIEKLIRENLQ